MAGSFVGRESRTAMKRIKKRDFVVGETVRLVVEAVLSSSKQVDQVATWLLAGYGLAGSLIIGNLEALAKAVHREEMRLGVVILVVGGLFGLAEKAMALNIDILLEIDRIMRERAEALETERSKESSDVSELDAASLSSAKGSTNEENW